MGIIKINKYLVGLFLSVTLLLSGCGGGGGTTNNTPGDLPNTTFIIDHTCTDLTRIPQSWIQEAKNKLLIAYGHTSHGSQLVDGMSGLVGFINGVGLGLVYPTNLFAWNTDGSGDALHLFEGSEYSSGDLELDCGYYPGWVNETTDFLGTPDPTTGRGQNHPEFNVIIWSWCTQVSGLSEQGMINNYLTPMSNLEKQYSGIKFVYMTGHLDGTGIDGNLHKRNEQIRAYCRANNKILYDFADIESYDPDGNVNYMELMADDNCDYDSDGDGIRDKNWAVDWQNSHTQNVDWYFCNSQHSQPLNANRKAYAAWWLWARLAGWEP